MNKYIAVMEDGIVLFPCCCDQHALEMFPDAIAILRIL